jgi:hypothetical protein
MVDIWMGSGELAQCLLAFTCKIPSMEFIWPNIHGIGLLVFKKGRFFSDRSLYPEIWWYFNSEMISHFGNTNEKRFWIYVFISISRLVRFLRKARYLRMVIFIGNFLVFWKRPHYSRTLIDILCHHDSLEFSIGSALSLFALLSVFLRLVASARFTRPQIAISRFTDFPRKIWNVFIVWWSHLISWNGGTTQSSVDPSDE